jgi:hypothetical protein
MGGSWAWVRSLVRYSNNAIHLSIFTDATLLKRCAVILSHFEPNGFQSTYAAPRVVHRRSVLFI